MSKEDIKVLDVCCGTRGMWFDKEDKRALYLDIRRETHIDSYPCGTKTNIINPDFIGDFTDIKQPNESFYLVVFDPPHIKRNKLGQITKKYGNLQGDWREMIRQGFKECFRILKPNGTLIFKWNEVQFPIKDILKLTQHKPLFGHKSGKKMQTHWVTFIK
jgi:23S rRNA G2069 N7-methylase RlmK/C1962 C5-methylase RlmI|tara:strand:+ start:60 stop:539 length:480 start_codon:yes stop_codon:yes gene_type:complete